MSAYDTTTRAIAAYGLPVGDLTFPDAPLDDDAWRMVASIATSQRIEGLLGRAVADGAFPVRDEQRADVERWEIDAARSALFLERVLLEVSDSFRATAIPARVLKGPALAHSVYPDPVLRSFADIDLLVPGVDFDRALAQLEAAGGTRHYAEPRPGFTRRFGKGVSLLRRDGYEVDLHRTFVSGPFGLLIDLDELFTQSTTFRVGGHDLLGLEREAQFVGACYHALLGSAPARLVPLRDVLQIALANPFDLERARELWMAWHGDAVVALAVEEACTALGVAPDFDLAVWAHAYNPTARERHYLGVYVDSSRSYARQALAGVSAVRGLRAKASYVSALAAPSAEYLRARDGGYFRRAMRAGRLTRNNPEQ